MSRSYAHACAVSAEIRLHACSNFCSNGAQRLGFQDKHRSACCLLLLLIRSKAALESKKRLEARRIALAQSHTDRNRATTHRIVKENARRLQHQRQQAQPKQPSCARNLNLSGKDKNQASDSVALNNSLQPPEPDEHDAHWSSTSSSVHHTRSTLASFDKDGSGVLGVSELMMAFRRLGFELTASQASSLVEELGTNDDGVIDIDELSTWLHNDADSASSGGQVHADAHEQLQSDDVSAETLVRAQLRSTQGNCYTPSHVRSPLAVSVSKAKMHLKSDELLCSERRAVAQLKHEARATAEIAERAAHEIVAFRLETEDTQRKQQYELQCLQQKHKEHLKELRDLAVTLRERQSMEREEQAAQRIAANRRAQQDEREWSASVNTVSSPLRF